MSSAKSVHQLNEREQAKGITDKGSWHEQYKDSPYIFVGGLARDLTEGDIRTVFSQYGEIIDVNLVRDKQTGLSKGFAFVGFEDQRSTILAVDNFNSIVLVGHVIRVDHVLSYKSPGASDAERKKLRNSKNYAELVDEELFKSATGDLMMIPPPNEAQSVETADASTASDLRAKRPRTFEEKELLRKYNEGLIDETEYRKSKRALKKALYNKKSAD